MKKLLPAIFSLIIILGCVVYLYLNPAEEEVEIIRSQVYVASANLSVPIYREENNLLHKYADLTRGTLVTSRNQNVDVNNGDFIFTEIEVEGFNYDNGQPEIFYISSTNLVESPDEVVRDDVKYVRTSATVYQDPQSPAIASYVKKGTELSVSGFYGLQEDGTVEMYYISNPGSEGYVYSKYLTDTLEEAEEVYAPSEVYHRNRTFEYELYGGSPETLDWYPYEKPVLEQGPVPEDIRAVYLNADAVRPDHVDSYITLAHDANANAFVVDIKNSILTYASDTAAQLSPTSYQESYLTVDQFAESMKKLQDTGLYLIGRIVVFNDAGYAADHPEDCIVSDVTEVAWPSAYSRSCWYYNVSLALEAAKQFSFHEIQFDYLRFPEDAYNMSANGDTDYRNTYEEEKAEAIQNFCFYAADQLHKAGVYLSVDVFGETVNEYVTAYGQYWPAISNVVDVISGMPYTDHFGAETDTWTYPYTTIYEWASKAQQRQKEIPTPAVSRTWITGYDVPNWNPVVTYGETQLTDQAQALYDTGMTGGFIPWNASSDLGKYYSYLNVWGRKY